MSIGSMNMVCFLCCADGGYFHFVIPHLASSLIMVPDSCAEAWVSDIEGFRSQYGDAFNLMDEIFGDRVLIRQMPFQTHPHLCRFIYKPMLQAPYTYIGDVDILTLDRGLLHTHSLHMHKNGICYSNKRRESDNALTGLHCVETKEYYDETEEFRRIMSRPDAWSYVRGRRKTSGFDELVLYDIVYSSFGEIVDLPERPVHGIHVSSHRPSNDWHVKQWRDEYLRLLETEEWKSLFPLMGSKFSEISDRIEAEL